MSHITEKRGSLDAKSNFYLSKQFSQGNQWLWSCQIQCSPFYTHTAHYRNAFSILLTYLSCKHFFALEFCISGLLLCYFVFFTSLFINSTYWNSLGFCAISLQNFQCLHSSYFINFPLYNFSLFNICAHNVRHWYCMYFT